MSEVRTTYYDNGYETKSNDLSNGHLLHEIKEFRSNNGNKKLEETYVNGVKNGLATRWSKNGNKAYEVAYVYGVLNGPYKCWDIDGKITVDGTFVNDVFTGKSYYYVLEHLGRYAERTYVDDVEVNYEIKSL